MTSLAAYQSFLEAKVPAAAEDGIVIEPGELSAWLKPHCKAIVTWALRGGRRAIFASFGLHKTAMQIEIVRLALQQCGGSGLIVLPLGVRQEFFREAQPDRLGTPLKFIRRPEEIEPGIIHLTNYETIRDGKPKTPFMKFGDTIRIEMKDNAGASIFGAIDQKVVKYGGAPG